MTMDTAMMIIYAEGSIMVIMLGVIGYFIIATAKLANNRMDNQDNRMDKMTEFMKIQQDQITALANKMETTIQLINKNQQNDHERMQFMQDLILGKGKLKPARA